MSKHTARKGLLAKVHVKAKRELGLSDAEYRATLQELFGVDSSTRLTIPQLVQLCDHFDGKSGRAPAGIKKTRRKADDTRIFVTIADSDPNATQKRYMLLMVKALGWSQDYLNDRCAKQFGVSQFAWLRDQAHLQTLGKDLWNRCLKKGLDPRALEFN